ncbi:MAG TPA: M20 family metallopeptidase [Chloroflexota bacterium]|nr:M20 family metallopeptidase [Chloroflexota bacterium]
MATADQTVVELTRQLVRINTVNPPGNEAAAVDHLARYLSQEGLSPETQEIAPGRTNLICRLRGAAPEGHLILSGHIDVVHQGEATWEQPPFAAERVGDRLIGRGVADMKGGVAAMATALVELSRSGFRPRADLVLAVSAGEEVDTAGARMMAREDVLKGGRMIVIGEPTGLDVYVAEKGVLWLRVACRGRTSHGSMPDLGVNAVSFAAALIEELERYPFPFSESPILGKPTLSINRIEGGVKTNVVPDLCTLEIDLRLVPGQEPDEVIRKLEQVVERLRDRRAQLVQTEIEVLQSMPPVETDQADPLVEAVMAAAAEVRGVEPAVDGVPYGTDAAVLAPALRASMVIFGPGKPQQAHQPNEYVDVVELEQASRTYALIARRLLD